MDSNTHYNISIVSPNENELTYNGSPYPNSLQLHTYPSNAGLLTVPQQASYLPQNVSVISHTEVPISGRPISPRPQLPQLNTSISPTFMPPPQHGRVSNPPNYSPAPSLHSIDNSAVGFDATYTQYFDTSFSSNYDASLLSARATLSPYRTSALEDPTQASTSPFHSPASSLTDLSEYVAVENVDDAAQGISPQSMYSPSSAPPLTPSPISPPDQLSPATYDNLAAYNAGANALANSPVTPGLSASSGFPSPSPRTGNPPLTPLHTTANYVGYMRGNGSVVNTPYSADGKELAPSPFIGGFRIVNGASPASSFVSLSNASTDSTVMPSNSNGYTLDGVSPSAVTTTGDNIATMTHTRGYSLPNMTAFPQSATVAMAQHLQQQQGSQGGLMANGVFAQGASMVAAQGYVPPYDPSLASAHARTQSLPEVQAMYLDMTSAHPPLPDPSTWGPQVPQRQYVPHTSSDRRRYVEEVSLDKPIFFKTRGDGNQVVDGIHLKEALTCRFMKLIGRDDSMFAGRGPSISVRLMWEGYAPWSRQIPTRDFRSPPQPITRAKLAKNVAKSVARFIEEHKDNTRMDPHSDKRWRVGPGKIDVDDLVLVSLHHVSMGSWQANLRLNRSL